MVLGSILLVYLLTTKSLSINDFKTIKRISFGGEGFPKNKLKQLYECLKWPGVISCVWTNGMYMYLPNNMDSDFENMNELAPLGNIANNFGYEIVPLDSINPDVCELQ